jgi:hypothetical protein
MAVKIDTLEKVPPHVAIAAGLGGKANPSHKWRVSARDAPVPGTKPGNGLGLDQAQAAS